MTRKKVIIDVSIYFIIFDANGAEVLYKYDYIGRITEVLAPKEAEAVRPYTLKFEYGTLFREYKSVMPYKFSGKEIDQETGYYYYGALYYDHSTALWLGVDPLAEKYPDVSPYVYCAGNLVCRVDYNGKDWYSTTNEDGSVSGKWFDSNATIIDDNDVMYNHVGKTMNGFDTDGNFIYGAQDGRTYTSAPLQEVEAHGNAEVAMARSIHKAQNAFLTSPQMKITALSMGALMWGPQALEASAPYIASAARYTYSATSNAAIATYNAGKYYGTTALINGIKGYGTAKAIAEYGISCAEMYSGVSFCTGVVDGFIRVLTDMPADTPYFIENPMFSFGSNAVNVGYNIYINLRNGFKN